MLLGFFYAEAQNIFPKNFTTSNGLPSTEIFQIFSDSKGYIWIASNSGVTRYDGYEFKNFDTKNGLPDNTVFEIYEDYKGRIWFLPLSLKLSFFNNDSIYEYKYNAKVIEYTKTSMIATKRTFKVDSADNVSFGIREKGIITISPDGNISRKLFGSKFKRHFINIEKDRIYCLPANRKVRELSILNNNKVSDINGILVPNADDLQYAVKLKNGRVIYSGYNLILDIKDSQNYQEYHVPTRVLWINLLSDGNIWYGTYKDGVYCIKNGDFRSKPLHHFFSGISVSSVCIDKEGGYWFSTLEKGIFYAPTLEINILTKLDGLSDERITCLASGPDKSILTGYYAPYIDHISENNIKKIEIYSSPNIVINCILQQEGFYYTGTNSMLCKIPGDIISGKKSYYVLKGVEASGAVLSMIQSLKGGYWIGSSFSITKFDGDTIVYNSTNKGHSIRGLDLLEHTDGSLWIGTSRGLWRYSNSVFTDYGKKDKRFMTRVNKIKRFNDFLCLGSKGEGLVLWNIPKNKIYQITKNEGLTSNSITCLLIEGSNIWAGTETGLNKISIQSIENNKYTIRNYTTYHGLISNNINDLLIKDSLIYLATNNGLASFNRFELKLNTCPPPVYITGFSANEKKINFSENIELKYDQNFIVIRFVGLNYKKAGNIKYRYKIDGLNETWLYTNNTYVQYPFLPDGKYRFVIEAQNEDGLWSSKSAIVSFTILPPFWKTAWFFILCILLILLLIFLYIKRREKRLVKEKKILEQKVTERTTEIIKQKNKIEKQAQELERLSIVARETSNAVIIMDRYGNIEWINEGFTRFYGYTLDQLFLLKGKNICDASENVFMNDILKTIHAKKEPVTYESHIRTKFGDKIWIQTSLAPIHDENGNIVMLIAIDSNINKLKIAEEEIMQQKEEIEAQRDELSIQKTIVEIKNKDITDSINYAKRIQDAILPARKTTLEMLGDSFVLHIPKDIVSGDLYWVAQKGDRVFFAAVDCTGHGVPGAFMSIVGHNALNRTINEFLKVKPSEILDTLNSIIDETLRNTETGMKDGMDIALCMLDRKNNVIEFAGANNPLYLLRNKKVPLPENTFIQAKAENENHILLSVSGDHQPIGAYAYRKNFTNHSINLHEGDTIYIFSDGYADQFGGTASSKGKKFMYTRLRALLLNIQNNTMEEQKQILLNNFYEWKGSFTQIDDICIVGVKI